VTGGAEAAGAGAAAGLWAVFVVGLTGGFGHCIAMCGPFVAASGFASAAATSSAPDVRAGVRVRSLAAWQAGYHGGRLVTYSAIGAALGSLGSIATVRNAIGPFQRWVWLAAGVVMVVLGLAAAGAPIFVRMGRAVESGVGAVTARAVGRAHTALSRLGPVAAVPTGMLMGLMPCGFLLSAEAWALGSGSALLGAATMLAFGLGTVPALAGFGAASGLLGTRARTWLAVAGGALVTVLGAVYIVRAASVLTGAPA
jgi:sulfite exporter TauE/SafE